MWDIENSTQNNIEVFAYVQQATVRIALGVVMDGEAACILVHADPADPRAVLEVMLEMMEHGCLPGVLAEPDAEATGNMTGDHRMIEWFLLLLTQRGLLLGWGGQP